MQIREHRALITQTTDYDEENQVLVNTVPAHNGRISAKFVFDGESVICFVLCLQCKDFVNILFNLGPHDACHVG